MHKVSKNSIGIPKYVCKQPGTSSSINAGKWRMSKQKERPKITPRLIGISPNSLESALEWVGNNQLGRRNLTPDQFRLLIGRKYNRLKKTKAESGSIGGASNAQNEQSLQTSEFIADEHGVSRSTVVRSGAAAELIDRQATPELKEIVQSGSVSINDAATVATFDDEKQIAIVAEINAGERILL